MDRGCLGSWSEGEYALQYILRELAGDEPEEQTAFHLLGIRLVVVLAFDGGPERLAVGVFVGAQPRKTKFSLGRLSGYFFSSSKNCATPTSRLLLARDHSRINPNAQDYQPRARPPLRQPVPSGAVVPCRTSARCRSRARSPLLLSHRVAVGVQQNLRPHPLTLNLGSIPILCATHGTRGFGGHHDHE